MALTEAQVANAKRTLSKLTYEEIQEVEDILKEIKKRQELVNPTAGTDDGASKFLLSIAMGEDQKADQDRAAVKRLTSLVEGN